MGNTFLPKPIILGYPIRQNSQGVGRSSPPVTGSLRTARCSTNPNNEMPPMSKKSNNVRKCMAIFEGIFPFFGVNESNPKGPNILHFFAGKNCILLNKFLYT